MEIETFSLSRPDKNSDITYHQKYWIERAEFDQGVTRQHIAEALGVGSNYVSMLKSVKYKAFLTMSQIPIFAKLCQLTDVEVICLYTALFKQKNGKQIDFDLPTMQWLFKEVIRLLQEGQIDLEHPFFTVHEAEFESAFGHHLEPKKAQP